MSVKKNGSWQVLDDGNVAKAKTFAEAVKIGLQRNPHKFGFRTSQSGIAFSCFGDKSRLRVTKSFVDLLSVTFNEATKQGPTT